MEHIKKAIDKIGRLKNELQQDLALTPDLFVRCKGVLETLISGLSHIAGVPVPDSGSNSSFTPSPIISVFGDDVTRAVEIPIDNSKATAADHDKLKAEAESAYESFLDRSNDDLMEHVEDMVLRAVAKKAGLEVTLKDPAVITSEFIDTIKEAIQNKINVVNAKTIGTTEALIDEIFEAALVVAKELEAEVSENLKAAIREDVETGLGKQIILDDLKETWTIAKQNASPAQAPAPEAAAAAVVEPAAPVVKPAASVVKQKEKPAATPEKK